MSLACGWNAPALMTVPSPPFFSMEGSLCKLPEIVELKKKYKAG